MRIKKMKITVTELEDKVLNIFYRANKIVKPYTFKLSELTECIINVDLILDFNNKNQYLMPAFEQKTYVYTYKEYRKTALTLIENQTYTDAKVMSLSELRKLKTPNRQLMKTYKVFFKNNKATADSWINQEDLLVNNGLSSNYSNIVKSLKNQNPSIQSSNTKEEVAKPNIQCANTSIDKNLISFNNTFSEKELTENQKEIALKLKAFATSSYMFINENYKLIKKDNKNIYKKISSIVDKNLKIMENIKPTFLIPNSNMHLYGLSYILDLKVDTTFTLIGCSNNRMDELSKYLKDKNFKIFYRKLLIVLAYNDECKDFIDLFNDTTRDNLHLISSIEGIVLTYFISQEKNITKLKMMSFYSKIINWNLSSISFSILLNQEQELTLNQIKTGIKYLKEKEDTTRENSKYSKSNCQYNLLDDMKNNITVKYVTNKDYKHLHHKSPIQHTRKGHFRHYKNNKTVWVESMIVGEAA